MGLPWPEWGETDYQLTQGYDAYRQLLCPHGGHYRDQCTDESTAGRWQMVADVCQATAAEQEFMKDHPDLEPGTLVGSYLLPEGSKAADPLEFNPAWAAAEAQAHQERMAAL